MEVNVFVTQFRPKSTKSCVSSHNIELNFMVWYDAVRYGVVWHGMGCGMEWVRVKNNWGWNDIA